GFFTEPVNGGQTVTVQSIQKGNASLQPEKADTTGVGVVLQPKFFSGFSASIDYYDITINGAIATLGGQQIIDQCFAGLNDFCSFIHRANGQITTIDIIPANFASQSTRGLDIEASYDLPLSSLVSSWDGSFRLRGLGTYLISAKTINNA